MCWNDLNSYLRQTYGCKVYKLALSSGCSCPNRMNGQNGCIFCDGAGAFAAQGDIPSQLAAARKRVSAKAGPEARYIAYFQSFTNTYAPAEQLRPLFTAAMEPEDVAVLSIATRPDCLPPGSWNFWLTWRRKSQSGWSWDYRPSIRKAPPGSGGAMNWQCSTRQCRH